MKVYNQSKTEILQEYDLSLGKLVDDTIEIPEVTAIEEQSHYEVVNVSSIGGRELEKVIDVEGREYQPAHTEDILVYIPYTAEELEEIELNKLREQREYECFSIINRGELWYARLTNEQRQELNTWYNAWLDVTETKIIPERPKWLGV